MKKAFNKISRLFVLCFIGCFIILNDSCGLDTILTLDAPRRHHTVDDCAATEAAQVAESYFTFSSAVSLNGTGTLLGVDLYYRIYTSKSECQTQKSNLESLANNNSTSYTSYDSMISKGYKALRCTGLRDEPLIRDSAEYYLRLVTDGTFTDESNGFYACLRKTTDVISVADRENHIPLRNLATNYQKQFSFDFGSNVSGEAGVKVKIPVSGDEDTNYSSFTEPNTYYVAVFTVAVAKDESFVRYYSPIEYLGSVKIVSATD